MRPILCSGVFLGLVWFLPISDGLEQNPLIADGLNLYRGDGVYASIVENIGELEQLAKPTAGTYSDSGGVLWRFRVKNAEFIEEPKVPDFPLGLVSKALFSMTVSGHDDDGYATVLTIETKVVMEVKGVFGVAEADAVSIVKLTIDPRTGRVFVTGNMTNIQSGSFPSVGQVKTQVSCHANDNENVFQFMAEYVLAYTGSRNDRFMRGNGYWLYRKSPFQSKTSAMWIVSIEKMGKGK